MRRFDGWAYVMSTCIFLWSLTHLVIILLMSWSLLRVSVIWLSISSFEVRESFVSEEKKYNISGVSEECLSLQYKYLFHSSTHSLQRWKEFLVSDSILDISGFATFIQARLLGTKESLIVPSMFSWVQSILLLLPAYTQFSYIPTPWDMCPHWRVF